MESAEYLLARAIELRSHGQSDAADDALRTCTKVYVDYAPAFRELGIQLLARGDTNGAIDHLSRAIAIDPHTGGYCNDLGIAYAQAGKRVEAGAMFRRALEIQPDSVDALNNLGLLLVGDGNATDALPLLKRATQLAPTFVRAQNNLGNALLGLGRHADAAVAYEAAIQADPNYVPAVRNRAICLTHSQRYVEQVHAAEALLRLLPGDAEGRFILASALLELGHLEASRTLFMELKQAGAKNARLECGLARIALQTNALEEATQRYSDALSIEPTNEPARVGLVLCADKKGQRREAREMYRQLAPTLSSATYAAELHGTLLFNSLLDPDLDPAERFGFHQDFGNRYDAAEITQRSALVTHEKRPLRVGFVSPDFRSHSVATFFLPVLACFDRSRMTLIAFSSGSIVDNVTADIKQHFDEWHDVLDHTDDQVARLIRERGVDVLIDLALHTSGNRLLVLAKKPVPIQATWLGYSGTSGMKTIDYHITDTHMNPVGLTDSIHTEQLLRLEGSAVVFQPKGIEVRNSPRNPRAKFTFGSVSQLMKLNARVAKVWSAILNRAPGTQLLIGNVNSHFESVWVRELFVPHLLNPDQLVLRPKLNFEDYLTLHADIDLMLDTFPFGGGTTTGFSLWMGVPVLTLDEPIAVPRMPGISLMRGAGLDEFIVPSEAQYIEKAVACVDQLAHLSHLRKNLGETLRTSTANSPQHLATSLQNALEQVWKRLLHAEHAQANDSLGLRV
jgi:protein O-GlcNAc transferase